VVAFDLVLPFNPQADSCRRGIGIRKSVYGCQERPAEAKSVVRSPGSNHIQVMVRA
jgi:hypothetical protein